MLYTNRTRAYGQTMVELALILGLVVIAALGALQGLGGALHTAWGTNIKPEMEAPKGPKVAAAGAGESFAAVTGTAGEAVEYELASGGTAKWNGSSLTASVTTGINDCDSMAPPGSEYACPR